MYTDLFVHQLTHLIPAMGVRFPRRVVGAGGLYLEYDGRDVPDVATVVADYDEGCQVLISATMCNDVQLPRSDPRPHRDDHVRAQGRRRLRGRSSRSSKGKPAPPGANQGEGGEQIQAPSSRARTPAPSGSTSSSASARATPKPSARPTSATRRSRRSTWASSRTAKARPSTSTRRPARSPTPTAPGPPAGKSAASSAASPTRSSAGRPATRARCSNLPELPEARRRLDRRQGSRGNA